MDLSTNDKAADTANIADTPVAKAEELVEAKAEKPDEKPTESTLPSDAYLKGAALRTDIVKCLKEIRKYEVKLDPRKHKQEVRKIETTLDELYMRFVIYDKDISSGVIKMLRGKNSLADMLLKNIFASNLYAQREMVRILLEECNTILNGYQVQKNNLTATAIAIAAIILSVVLGLLSLAVAILQLYLSSEPTILWLPPNA